VPTSGRSNAAPNLTGFGASFSGWSVELPDHDAVWTVAPPRRGELLDMYPLLNGGEGEPGYTLAGPAFEAGTLRVTEVSESGSVPTLRVVNEGPRPVLLVDGEELAGAKQNRVLNMTVMVPARRSIDVPVSCVEAGRWRYSARKFKDAEWLMDSEGRARKMRNVSDSLRRGSYAGSQRDVWSHISEKAARMGARSETSAQEAMFTSHRRVLDQEIEALMPAEGQVGAVFASRGRVIGLELFDATKTLQALLPKIVRSYAIDACDSRGRVPRRAAMDVEQFTSAVTQVESSEYPTIGLGKTVRMEGRGLAGAGLLVDDRYVHLSILALSPMAR